jgi:hypothetical protein
MQLQFVNIIEYICSRTTSVCCLEIWGHCNTANLTSSVIFTEISTFWGPPTVFGYRTNAPQPSRNDTHWSHLQCVPLYFPPLSALIMIGKSIKDYVIIRIAILALRLVAPASLVYLAASLYQMEFLLSIWLGLYAFAESALYLLVYLPRSYLMQKAS